jgi:predicted outer membrane protein
LGNWEEIQLGQFASQKAQHPQVKEFAQKMVQEHRQALEKLQPYLRSDQWDELSAEQDSAARAGQDRPGQARPGAQDAAARANPQDGQPGRQPGAQGEAHGQQIAQVYRDAARNCLTRTKELLSEKQGADFDKCYIGGQVMAHIGMLAKLEAAQGHVSPEFQQINRQLAQTTEQHFKEAQSIAQAIEQSGQPGRQPARQPGLQPGAPREPGAQPGREPAAQPGAPREPGAQPGAPREPAAAQPGQPDQP